jgi:hypothetical protein
LDELFYTNQNIIFFLKKKNRMNSNQSKYKHKHNCAIPIEILLIYQKGTCIPKDLHVKYPIEMGPAPSHYKTFHSLSFLAKWKTRGRCKIWRWKISHVTHHLFHFSLNHTSTLSHITPLLLATSHGDPQGRHQLRCCSSPRLQSSLSGNLSRRRSSSSIRWEEDY